MSAISQTDGYTPAIQGLCGVQKGISFQVTDLFITWPRCDVDKQETGLLLRELLDPLFLIVGEEAHADGTPHLHAFVKLGKRTRVYHADLDIITGKHGNYQCARSAINCVRYCAKDGDYYSIGIYCYKSIGYPWWGKYVPIPFNMDLFFIINRD